MMTARPRRSAARPARRITARLQRARDERGSLPMAMLITIVGVGLAALMLPLVLVQVSTTSFEQRRGRALHAAQSGIEVALGQIRAAQSDGQGDTSKLPCLPLSGTVSDGGGSYSVSIDYFVAGDPDNHGAGWRTSNRMTCPPPAGPSDPISGLKTPRYALLTSTGAGSSAGTAGAASTRTVVSTYVFTTDDTNVPGGVIKMFAGPDGDGVYCLDAGAAPVDDSPLQLRRCSSATPAPASQRWLYRENLSIQLADSATDGDAGLCVDVPYPDGKDKHATGQVLTLHTCETSDGHATPEQTWSINGGLNFEGTYQDEQEMDGRCFYVAGQASGAPLTLDTCTTDPTDPQRSWVLSPSAGNGREKPKYGHLINFQQFGLCLTVPDNNPPDVIKEKAHGGTYKGHNYTYYDILELSSCKQDPDPDKVYWNQKFGPYPELGDDDEQKPQTVVLIARWHNSDWWNKHGTKYCLRAPDGTGENDDGLHVQIRKDDCSEDSTVAAYRWKVYRKIGDDGRLLPYAERYRIVSESTGKCLDVGADDDLYHHYNKVVIDTCNGSKGQKWNADPSITSASLQDIHEN